MVTEDEPIGYDIVLTPNFLDDLSECVDYIANQFKSPATARKTYKAIRAKVLDLKLLPQAAINYVSPTTGTARYIISYKRFDIHYCIDGKVVRVLGLKHQLQSDDWV